MHSLMFESLGASFLDKVNVAGSPIAVSLLGILGHDQFVVQEDPLFHGADETSDAFEKLFTIARGKLKHFEVGRPEEISHGIVESLQA